MQFLHATMPMASGTEKTMGRRGNKNHAWTSGFTAAGAGHPPPLTTFGQYMFYVHSRNAKVYRLNSCLRLYVMFMF